MSTSACPGSSSPIRGSGGSCGCPVMMAGCLFAVPCVLQQNGHLALLNFRLQHVRLSDLFYLELFPGRLHVGLGHLLQYFGDLDHPLGTQSLKKANPNIVEYPHLLCLTLPACAFEVPAGRRAVQSQLVGGHDRLRDKSSLLSGFAGLADLRSGVSGNWVRIQTNLQPILFGLMHEFQFLGERGITRQSHLLQSCERQIDWQHFGTLHSRDVGQRTVDPGFDRIAPFGGSRCAGRRNDVFPTRKRRSGSRQRCIRITGPLVLWRDNGGSLGGLRRGSVTDFRRIADRESGGRHLLPFRRILPT